jgi:uncharacterized membrane protein
MHATGGFSFMLHPIFQGIGWMMYHFFLATSLFFYIRNFEHIADKPKGDFSWVLGWYIVLIVLNWVVPFVSATFLSFIPTFICTVAQVVSVVLIFVYEIQYTDGEGPKHLNKGQNSPIWLMIPVLVWVVIELVVCAVIVFYNDFEYQDDDGTERNDTQRAADRGVYSTKLEAANTIAAIPGNVVTSVQRNLAENTGGHVGQVTPVQNQGHYDAFKHHDMYKKK